MNIPVPNKGHWQKVKGGRSVQIKSLPLDYKGKNEVTLTLRTQNTAKQSAALMLKSLVKEIENDKTLPLKVAERLTNPCELVISVQKELTQRKNIYGGVAYSGRGNLSIQVTPQNVPRALRIFDGIIRLFRSRNHDIIVDYNGTYIKIGDEKMKVSLKEKLTMVYSEKNKQREFRLSGKLSFRTDGYQPKMWYDDKHPLEDQLAKILAYFEIKAEQLRVQRLKWEEDRRIRDEQERIRREEKERKERELARFNELLKQANQWQQVQILRQYISAVEANAIHSGTLNDELSNWLGWAKQKADGYDPLSTSKLTPL